MKVLVYGKNAKNIAQLVKNFNLEIVTPLANEFAAGITTRKLISRENVCKMSNDWYTSNPDVVISYGGDGTLLASERTYPGIPKLPIRNSLICKKCSKHDEKVLLQNLLNGELKFKEYRKLETTFFYKTFYAFNDFVIRNSDPTHTIRFKLTFSMSSLRRQGSINNKLLIGDGIVISTVFGSTGYFKSITRKSFEEGFGIAFNNTTEKFPPVFLKNKDKFSFQLIRGKATLSFDNSLEIFNIDEGSELIFKLSGQFAKIYQPDSLRCPNCKVIRG